MRFTAAAASLLAVVSASAPRAAAAFAPASAVRSVGVGGVGSIGPSGDGGGGGGLSVSAGAIGENPTSPPEATASGGGATSPEGGGDALTYGDVNALTFRQLRKGCKDRGLPAGGNTAALRGRLLEYYGIGRPGGSEEAGGGVNGAEAEAAASSSSSSSSEAPAAAAAADVGLEECDPEITFCDESDPDFDYKSLRRDVIHKAEIGHWKSATRKLKKLKRTYATPDRPVDPDVYVAVLTACAEDRLHGARASEPARKIMEDMSELGYSIPPHVGNGCVVNCIGTGPGGKHDGCGGVDTALAMLAAMEGSPRGPESVAQDTYGAVVTALGRDGAVEEAILLLRAMVVERSFTPPLGTFSDVAHAAAKDGNMAESVLQVLTLAKAAGYELDSIASAQVGRELLASGVIAAEQMDNVALGLRLLTAAGKAEGCAPDRGDDLVACSSAAAQRACTLIHKRAIDMAVQDSNWKLAVKLLELMPERSLTPATSVWRKVLTVCAKCEKSRKATAILLDWVKLAEQGKADAPPLSAFNTVVNACEVCGEEELTLTVLDTMRRTLGTEGNLITSNIALKRLAKLGNARACEGLVIGMLQAGMEPNVVSYTTAMGACANEPKDPAFAYEWLKRMRSRNVMPNFHTYNTALAACLDGRLESTVLGSTIATEMLADVDRELEVGLRGSAEYNSVIPDAYTKVLARSLMKQLRENWRSGDINMQVAKATVRVPLLRLVDFEKSEAAERVKKQMEEAAAAKVAVTAEGENMDTTERDDSDLEYSLVNKLHKDTHRIAEV